MEITSTPQCWSKDDLLFVGSCMSTKGVTIAVVDADTIMQHGKKLSGCADRLVSIPEVIDQITQSNFLPYAVEPSPDSVKKVVSFASKIGFLRRFSEIDLKLIALTCMLDSMMHGSKQPRDTPINIHTTFDMTEKYLTAKQWMLRSLSKSRIACISTNFTVQNMILQMGLRLLTVVPIMKIYEIQRWVLRCHVCASMSTEMGSENCPDCGNMVTLCKAEVTVIENSVDDHAFESNVNKTQTWSNMPQDVLDLIFNKLYFTSRIRFRGVCKDWRIPIGTRIDNELPWIICPNLTGTEIMLLDPVHKRVHKTFDSESRHSVLIRTSIVCGSKNGWLIYRVGKTGNLILFFVYCPFTGKLITLPMLHCVLNFEINSSTFSSNPMSPDCIFVVTHAGNMQLLGISTCRIGDLFWRTKIFDKDGFVCNSLRQVCTSKGICYIVFFDGKLGSFCLETHEWSWLIEFPCWEVRIIYMKLVEFNGGLLTVIYYGDCGMTELYRYDEKERVWIEEKSLGNRALFLDSYGYCLRSTFEDTSDLADTIVRIPPLTFCTEITAYSLKDQKFCKKKEAYEWMETNDLCDKIWIEPPYW